jgi:hypothetical protein
MKKNLEKKIFFLYNHMSSLQSDLDELQKLEIELKNLRSKVREFSKQKETVEGRIKDFLKNQETHGVRYQNKAIVLEETCQRNKKKKVDKLNDIAQVLSKYGLQRNDAMIGEILDAQRGATQKNEILKVVQRK